MILDIAGDAHELLDLLHRGHAIALALPPIVLDADADVQAERDRATPAGRSLLEIDRVPGIRAADGRGKTRRAVAPALHPRRESCTIEEPRDIETRDFVQ